MILNFFIQVHLPHGGVVMVEPAFEIYASVYYTPSPADYDNIVGRYYLLIPHKLKEPLAIEF